MMLAIRGSCDKCEELLRRKQYKERCYWKQSQRDFHPYHGEEPCSKTASLTRSDFVSETAPVLELTTPKSIITMLRQFAISPQEFLFNWFPLHCQGFHWESLHFWLRIVSVTRRWAFLPIVRRGDERSIQSRNNHFDSLWPQDCVNLYDVVIQARWKHCCAQIKDVILPVWDGHHMK
jgi:hypothetical protein